MGAQLASWSVLVLFASWQSVEPHLQRNRVPKGTIIATLNKQTNAAVLDSMKQRFADLAPWRCSRTFTNDQLRPELNMAAGRGRSWTVVDGSVYFSSFTDGRTIDPQAWRPRPADAGRRHGFGR
jgi:hypothetical protein